MNSREVAILLLPAFKHWGGKFRREYLIELQHEFWDEMPDKRCHICRKWVNMRNRSIDHMVPITICMKLELFGLIFDKRNFAMAHRDCNSSRHHDISDLPPAIIAKLRAMGYTEDN